MNNMDRHDGTSPNLTRLTFYRLAEVARLLRCSEWWVKEQARRRRIPHCRIGGGYRFTDAHVAEIARLFEVRPSEDAPVQPVRRRPDVREPGTVSRLRARPPRRARDASTSTAA